MITIKGSEMLIFCDTNEDFERFKEKYAIDKSSTLGLYVKDGDKRFIYANDKWWDDNTFCNYNFGINAV
jgi:hypothetical protein